VVRQDLSDAEKYRLAQADTLTRLIKADSIEKAERMLSDASIQSFSITTIRLIEDNETTCSGWIRSRLPE
jgi:hypothetical protein